MNTLSTILFLVIAAYFYVNLINWLHGKLVHFQKWSELHRDLQDSIEVKFLDGEVMVTDSPIPPWEVCMMDETGRAFFWDDLKFLYEDQTGREVRSVGIHLKLDR